MRDFASGKFSHNVLKILLFQRLPNKIKICFTAGGVTLNKLAVRLLVDVKNNRLAAAIRN